MNRLRKIHVFQTMLYHTHYQRHKSILPKIRPYRLGNGTYGREKKGHSPLTRKRKRLSPLNSNRACKTTSHQKKARDSNNRAVTGDK